MEEVQDGMLTEALTERELEIVRLIADGLSNRDIGGRLDVSTETVKWYNKRIFAKLDVRSRTQAVARARESGLLQESAAPPAVVKGAEPQPRHNLPAQLTSFVGREQEIETIERLLQTNRLLTLTGTGGAGKTRLALEVALRVASHYNDGVSFVPLAPLDDPDLVLDSVAQALGVKEQPGESLPATLRRFLARRQLLLLLDNFEHLLPGAPPLAGLLAAAPQLTLLVTSREPLRLYGEQEFAVPPLELPWTGDEPLAAHSPAVQLFADRARAARLAFKLDEQNAAAVAQICALLDGLPLAIELAAAHSRLFAPPALLARLRAVRDDESAAPNLRLLSDGPRDVPHRQQTLRATIDWSYHLLIGEEQRLFRCLAAFAGGCTLEAVHAVCAGEHGARLDVVDLLSSLVDKNLLRVGDGPEQEPRFAMLHVIREYARERLQRHGEAQAIAGRHARYYLELAEQSDAELIGSQQAAWLARLETEHDNLRSALGWARRNGEAELGLRLARALGRFWLFRSHYREGRQWLEGMLALNDAAPAKLRASAVHGMAELAHYQRDLATARSANDLSLRLRRELRDRVGISDSLTMLGLVLQDLGDYERADTLLEECLVLSRELGDRTRIAYALSALGMGAMSQGNQPRARSMLEEALDLMRAQGDDVGIGSALNNLGMVALYEGENERAQQLFESSLDFNRPQEVLHFYHTNRMGLGLAVARLGNLDQAASIFVAALQAFLEIEDRLRIAQCLEGLAEVATARRQHARVVTLWGAAEALRETLLAPLPPVEQREQDGAQAAMRRSMPPDAFQQAWEEGRRLTLQDFDALIAFALSTDAPDNAETTTSKPVPHVSEAALTPREVEVLHLVAQGLTDAQVAETLVISPRTVNAHLTSIYSKLEVNSRTAAARVALENGWV